MNVVTAILTAIRTALVLALVGSLAFGSLAGSASAATGGDASAVHFSAVAVSAIAVADGDHEHRAFAAKCPAQAGGASHDMHDESCCVGTCTTILGVLAVADVPASRISEIEPFDIPLSARGRVAEFLRPPSLTI